MNRRIFRKNLEVLDPGTGFGIVGLCGKPGARNLSRSGLDPAAVRQALENGKSNPVKAAGYPKQPIGGSRGRQIRTNHRQSLGSTLAPYGYSPQRTTGRCGQLEWGW
uniref:Uncharacterized protein n=1 Tax=Candidatus Kentrum sp. LFY TaxID=2126342 RepID=A0A450WRC1_9GAMM|nr:MAG: hypothetical protein BECKLFY1418C_GA0070996_105917 [Candidatus Kentron sp. LFY]